MIAFISRPLSFDSDFQNLLQRAGWEVQGASLVQLTPLSVSKIPAAEWWFFSSQNAARFFLSGRNIPPLLRIGALGVATAEAIERQIGRLPDFTGNGDPEDTAKAFYTVAKKQRVIFPGAANSLQSVQQRLEGLVEGIHVNVYDNIPSPNPPDMTDAHALVFTSPLNAKAYFKKYALSPGQKVVAIGASTASALNNLGVEKVQIAAEPNEKALAALLLG